MLEWTDLTKIANLSTSNGNFHSFHKKVIYTTIIKNAQG